MESRTAGSIFLNATELSPFAGQDWFMTLAIQAWGKGEATESLSSYAAALVHKSGAHLLTLAVAAADPDRPGGDWALWTGRIREARLDREGDQTLIKAEGVEIKTEATEDEKVVSVEAHPTFLGRFEATPTYKTERSYRDVAVPNGREFLVRYPHAKENIVGMRTISAFGRFTGRDKDLRVPALDAIVVIKREGD
jgi:hypothetical protein